MFRQWPSSGTSYKSTLKTARYSANSSFPLTFYLRHTATGFGSGLLQALPINRKAETQCTILYIPNETDSANPRLSTGSIK
jgi:hypothetical protein